MNWMMPYLEAASSRFVASEHMSKLISTALLSMVPLFEGRYAVSTSILMGVPAGFAFLLALVFSTIPMPLILLLLRPVLDWFYTLPIPPVRKFAAWVEHRSDKKRARMTQPVPVPCLKAAARKRRRPAARRQPSRAASSFR